METAYVDDLCDRTDWIAASIELQTSHDATTVGAVFTRISTLQRRIVERCREGELPFHTLAKRLLLSETEQQIVMLLVAMRSQPEVRSKIQQGVSAAELSLDAIRTLIYGSQPSRLALQELSSTGTLRRLLVIERNDEGAACHESKQTWSIAPRVLALLHGDDAIDPALSRLCRTSDGRDLESIAASDEAKQLARSAVVGTGIGVATGLEGLGRRTLLNAAAKAAGRSIVEIDTRRLSKDSTILGAQLRTVARECKLLARTPLLTNLDVLVDEKESRIDLVGRELSALIDGPILVTTGIQRPRIDWDRPVIVIEMTQPSSAHLRRDCLGECRRPQRAKQIGAPLHLVA